MLVGCARLLSEFSEMGRRFNSFALRGIGGGPVGRGSCLENSGAYGFGGSSPSASAKKQPSGEGWLVFFKKGVRQRWRVEPDCKSGASAE